MKPRIFISYARKDGEEFAVDLRTGLADVFGEDALWRDRDRMEGGRDWWQQIVAALEVVDFMVLVATPEAMESPVVRKEWRAARQMGVCVCPILDPKLPIDFSLLPRWMRDSHFYNVNKEWNTFVAFLTAPCNVPRVPFMAPDLPANYVERAGPFEELKTRLLDHDYQNPVAVTTALQGAGGFGKTTLAAALCHDEDIQTAFDDGILWVTLGEQPNLVNELGKLYRSLAKEEPTFKDAEEGGRIIAEKLTDLDCLIVIDDVWNSMHLRPFLRGGDRCARLITTRNIGIATSAKAAMTEVDEMTVDEATKLLGAGLDGADRTQLQKLAGRLGEYAQMLEIANGMMRERIAVSHDTVFGAMVWLTKLLDRKGILGIHRDDEATRRQDIAGVLDSSVELLKPDQRTRLCELGVFKDDEAIPLSSVMKLWGQDDFDTEDDIVTMARLALVKFSIGTNSIRLHDVVREYLLTQIPDIAALHGQLINAWGDPYALPDDYAWRYYIDHLYRADKIEDLRALLLDFHWLHEKLDATNAAALIADFDVPKHEEVFHLIQRTIRLSLGALTADKRQLAPQLVGRLSVHQENPEIAMLIGSVAYPSGTFESLSPHFQGYIQAGGPLLRVLDGHTAIINGALALADGRLLSWSRDNTLRLWTADGTLLHTLEGHADSVTGALPLHDGRLLSWSNDHTLRLWAPTGSPLRTLDGHTYSVRAALELQDGQLLSWSLIDNTLRLWTTDGAPLRTLNGHTSQVNGALALTDGRLLSWSYDRTLRLWAADGTPLQILNGHRGRIIGALALIDGRLLSWSDDCTLRLWTADGTPLRMLSGHTREINGALALADGRLLSWSGDATLRLWTADGVPLRTLDGHTGPVRDVLALDDGRLLSWSSDPTLRLWAADGSPLRTLDTLIGRFIGALALSDGRVLSWSDDFILRQWTTDGMPLHPLNGHTAGINGALALTDGRVLSWSYDLTLRLWAADEIPMHILESHTHSVRGALALTDGMVLSWSDDSTLRLWTTNGSPLFKLEGHTGPVNGVLEVHDRRLLSWSEDRTLQLWTADGSPICTLDGHSARIIGALALTDGQLLSWSVDSTLRLWTADGSPIRTLVGHSARISGALALRDGQLLSWSDDSTLRLWADDGSPIRTLNSHTLPVLGALQLRDGRLLSWSLDTTLRLWTADGVPLYTLNGHTGQINGTLALADGRFLSWSGDTMLRMWTVDGSALYTLEGHTAPVLGALALIDGRLLSWSRDGTLRLWAADGVPLRTLDGHISWVNGALALHTGQLLSWSGDSTLRLWDQSGSPLAAFYGDAPITCCTVLSETPLHVVIGDRAGRVNFLRLVE